MRIVGSSTATNAPVLFGTSSAVNNTGAFTETARIGAGTISGRNSGQEGLVLENYEASGRTYGLYVGGTGTFGAGATWRGRLFLYDSTGGAVLWRYDVGDNTLHHTGPLSTTDGTYTAVMGRAWGGVAADAYLAAAGGTANLVFGLSGVEAGRFNSTGLMFPTGGILHWNGRSQIASPADGVIRLTQSTGSDFTRLAFGGTSSSEPALQRNGTGLDVMLADGSAYTSLAAGILKLPNSGAIQWNGSDVIVADASNLAFRARTSDNITLTRSGGSDFGRLNFGGQSAGEPALKRSGTGLLVRLADDSAYAALTAYDLTATNLLRVTSSRGFTMGLAAGEARIEHSGGTFSLLTTADAAAALSVGTLSIGNALNVVSPTSPNRTVTMVIGGTTIYLHGKTTND